MTFAVMDHGDVICYSTCTFTLLQSIARKYDLYEIKGMKIINVFVYFIQLKQRIFDILNRAYLLHF